MIALESRLGSECQKISDEDYEALVKGKPFLLSFILCSNVNANCK